MSVSCSFRITLIVAGLSLGAITAALAQENNGPQNVPPPQRSWSPPPGGPSGGPPSFTPPPPPTGLPGVPPPRMPRSPGNIPPLVEPSSEVSSRDSDSLRFEDPGSPSQAVPPSALGEDAVDPGRLAAPGVNLNESVGLIQIPELGNNEVLEMLENLTQKPILRQQSLPQVRITFFSQGPLTRGEAITAIESLLALNGVAITKLGDTFLKAVPLPSVNAQVPTLLEGSTLNLTPSQKVYAKLFQLDFLTPEEAAASLQQFLTQGLQVAFSRNNTLMVTDSLVNLQRVESLLEKIDRPAPLNTQMMFFQLKNIDSQDALRRLQTLQQGSLRTRLEGNTTFDADERTNQLIVSTHPSNLQLIEQVVERLDMDVEPLTRTEIFDIRHAEAIEVAEVIKEVVTGQERVRDQQTGQRVRRAPNQQQQQQSANEGPGVQFSQYLTVVPDERTNTIVATGTPSDLRLMSELIERLDAILPQVRIEVVITEVSLNNEEASGLNAFGFRYARKDQAPDGAIALPDGSTHGFGDGTKDAWLSPVFNPMPEGGGSPLTVAPFALQNFTLDAVFSVAETSSRVQVLSAPTIVTTHNREAAILVGDQIPVVTSTARQLDQNAVSSSQVQFRDVALELKVKPLIGMNGVVQLEIEQKFDTVTGSAPVAPDVAPQPIIATRQTTSFVSVRSGELVILGGLQRVSDREDDGKVFILGDIPVLGKLFRPSSEVKSRTELLIFIRPVVLNTTTDSFLDAQAGLARIEAADRVEHYLQEGTFDPPPPEGEEAPTTKRVLRRGQWVDVPVAP